MFWGAWGSRASSAAPLRRLAALSAFQLAALTHALSFPSVRRVAYSTCSVHAQENELVIRAALEAAPHFRLAQGTLPTWPYRGIDAVDGNAMVRTDASRDHTIGFFVAVLERVAEGPPLVPVARPRADDETGMKERVEKKKEKKEKKIEEAMEMAKKVVAPKLRKTAADVEPRRGPKKNRRRTIKRALV